MAAPALYLDEDVNPKLADILGERGYDVWTTVEADNLGQTDEVQLAFSTQHQRALLTHNIGDFVKLAQHYADRGLSHAGIVVSDQLPLKSLLQRTIRLLAMRSAADMRDRLEWLSDYR